jgi:hypothetical protein
MPRHPLHRHSSAAAGGPRAQRLASRNGVRMSWTLRAALYLLGALLWLSGVLWLVVHFGFPERTSFGPVPNAWEPGVLRLHGLIAVVGVFLLGWITAAHVIDRWAGGRNRLTGLTLAGSGAFLLASGYALYYTTGALHDVAARTHEWLGVASLLAALAHWWRARPMR